MPAEPKTVADLFHEELEPRNMAQWIECHGDTLCLDGDFTLPDLRCLVTAWEKAIQRHDRPQG
jgi:hypothetical protein